jgi:hypothetical protein
MFDCRSEIAKGWLLAVAIFDDLGHSTAASGLNQPTLRIRLNSRVDVAICGKALTRNEKQLAANQRDELF